MQAIILAAGYSTRLGALTKSCPKALLPLGGKPALEHLIAHLDATERIDEIIIVSNHLYIDTFLSWRKGFARENVTILDDGTSSNEERLGALGDLAFALREKNICGDVLVAACDNIFDFSLSPMFELFDATGAPVLLGKRIDDMAQLRRFAVAQMGEGGRVLSMEEKPKEPRGDVGVFAVYIYPQSALRQLCVYSQSGAPMDAPGHFPVWLCGKTDVYAHITQGNIYDIGLPETLAFMQEQFTKQG